MTSISNSVRAIFSLTSGSSLKASISRLFDLGKINIDIGLHRHIDRGALAVVAGKPRQTVERVPQRVQPRQRDLQ